MTVWKRKQPSEFLNLTVAVGRGWGDGEVNYFPPPKNTIARKELSDSRVPGQQDVKIHADVTFLLWRWEKETDCHWSMSVTAEKGLDVMISVGLGCRIRFTLPFFKWIWWVEDSPGRNINQQRKLWRTDPNIGLGCCSTWFSYDWLPSGISTWHQVLRFFVQFLGMLGAYGCWWVGNALCRQHEVRRKNSVSYLLSS